MKLKTKISISRWKLQNWQDCANNRSRVRQVKAFNSTSVPKIHFRSDETTCYNSEISETYFKTCENRHDYTNDIKVVSLQLLLLYF